MEATNLSLAKWFQAFYLVGDAKIGICSLSMMRKEGCKLSWCMLASQQDYASDELAGEILCAPGKHSAV
jgi:hypothetical protein